MSRTKFASIIIGDIHGRKDLLVDALRTVGLIDEAGHWSGGNRRLVQMGDVIDRGPEPLAALDFLMRLQAEARLAGGEVVCLLGNHELFALRAAMSEHAERMAWTYNGGGANYCEWMARQGLAGQESDAPYPEPFYELFAPDGHYGRWIHTHQIAYRLGDYVLVHGGWTPECPPTLEAATGLNPLTMHNRIGLLWARRQPEAQIRAACAQLGCRGLIIGHTPGPGIRTSFEGRLIETDVGMVFAGAWAALGMDEAGDLWTIMADGEPQRLEGDGLIPLSGGVELEGAAQPAPVAYGPGALVQLYRAADDSWCRYFYVEEAVDLAGTPGYEGRMVTRDGVAWSAMPAVWPAARIDRFGRPAPLAEVPADLLA